MRILSPIAEKKKKLHLPLALLLLGFLSTIPCTPLLPGSSQSLSASPLAACSLFLLASPWPPSRQLHCHQAHLLLAPKELHLRNLLARLLPDQRAHLLPSPLVLPLQSRQVRLLPNPPGRLPLAPLEFLPRAARLLSLLQQGVLELLHGISSRATV